LSALHYIPDGWKRLSLHQLALIQTGVAKGKKDIKNPIECPYLRVANVQDGHLDLAEVKTIRIASNELNRYSLRHGDVLMTEGGDFDKLGRGFVWEEQIPGCLHQNHVFAVRPDTSKLDPYFLSYQAGSSYGKGYFVSCSKQSTNLASINSSQLKEYPVLLPPLQEQKAIVLIVQRWDCAIDHTESLIAAKQERRTWLMQQLLAGKRRLPGFIKPWARVKIGEVLKEVKRPVKWNDDDLYRLISVRRRSEGLFLREELYGHQIKTKKMNIAKEGDFLISKMQIVHGASGLVTKDFDGMNISDSYISLRAQEPKSFEIDFFNWLSKLPHMYHHALFSSYGVHIEKMTFNLSDYLKQRIFVPPYVEEQKAIVNVLRTADHELDLLRTQLDALREQKKGMMQQLLTGKIRVKVVS
jgi:type I restriction enzyme S subunit